MYTKDYSTQYQTSLETTTSAVYRDMYGWMAAALGLSALTAYVVMNLLYTSEAFANIFLSQGCMWVMIIASFALVMGIGGAINRLSAGVATLLFALYSVLMGAWMTPVLLMYTAQSVFQVFLITAGTFGGMAIYGHFTKRDLSKVGSICGMALWGLILASLVNLFFKSPMVSYITSYVGVAIFCGLTMWDVQKFRTMIYEYGQADSQTVRKIALMGALTLYLDFLNLFLYLLRILGARRSN